MIIKFNNMTIHNFMSYADATINFNHTGYTLISGVNNNITDNASSNGSGKSAIWEALTWCITGETIRGSKVVANEFTDDGCYVKLEFQLDNDKYQIIRSKDSKEYKTNLLFYLNGEDKSGKGIRDTSKILSEYIPDITSSLLGSVIILGQGLPMKFTSNSPAGRKEVLEKLIKSDFMIADLKDRISKRKTELDTAIRKFEDAIIVNKTKLESINNNIISYTDRLNALQDINTAKEILSAAKEMLDKKTASCIDIQRQLKECEDERNIYTQQYQDKTSEYNKEVLSLNEGFSRQTNDLIIQANDFTNQINFNNREISRLKNVKDRCPTCGQKLPGVTKPDTSELEISNEELKARLGVANQQLAVIRGEEQKAKTDLNNSYANTMMGLKNTINTLTNQYNQLRSEESLLENQIKTYEYDIKKYTLEIESYENRRADIQKEIDNNIRNKSIVENEILYNTNELDNIKQHSAVIARFNSIITRDFRGILLSNVIDYINIKAKEYCKDIFDTESINFELDGNNISISYNTKEYESLSGGERQKIDLIVQFSIRDMLCQFMNFSSNILVLDEITDNLDMVGCQNVIKLISNKLQDVESIYIISHRQDLNIPVDRKLIVEKTIEGFSTIHE